MYQRGLERSGVVWEFSGAPCSLKFLGPSWVRRHWTMSGRMDEISSGRNGKEKAERKWTSSGR